MTGYEVKKFLEEHRYLILHLAQEEYQCTCHKLENSTCTECDKHRLYNDLASLLEYF